MDRRPCGTSRLDLSVLGLGCWQFGGGEYWGESDPAHVTRFVHQAVDLGVNYFDTAEMYNQGRSEEYLGRALKGIPRDRIVIGSKVWPTHMRPEDLRASCEGSLRRLDLEAIDIYMIHWPLNPRTYPLFAQSDKDAVGAADDKSSDAPRLAEAVATLLDLQREGKIRHLGVSNYGVERLRELEGIGGRYVVDQVIYNLVSRAAEFELLPHCQQAGIGVMSYMTVMQGLLTDRYAAVEEIPDRYARTRHFDSRRNPLSRHGGPGVEVDLARALKEVREIAREGGWTTADLAIRWAIAAPGMTCVLIGSQSLESLKANVSAAEGRLPAEVIERLDRVTRPLKERLGPSLDIFESAENDRTR